MKSKTEMEIRATMFREACKRGYCDIYSNHDETESALIRVAQEIFTIERKKK